MTHKESDQGVPPEPSPEPGWKPIAIKDWPRSDFLQPESRGDRTKVSYFYQEGDDHIYADAWFGPGAEGGPGIVHGGAISAVLDEIMGFCCWHHGHPVVTGSLTIHFRKSLPINTEAKCDCWIEKVDGRKIYLKSNLTDSESGDLYAEGESLFIQLSDEQLQALAERYQAKAKQ